MLAIAGPAAMPDPDSIRALRIAGALGIKLHRGTWHAGPFFTAPTINFISLELSDTNEVDHANYYLAHDRLQLWSGAKS
jgi:ureidoglycolate hydrolase